MITTCTLNPSIDYFVQLDSLNIGEVNRMNADKKVPGGKGINVSRVLTRLGIANKATGFLGGFTGDFIESELRSEQIEADFVKVRDDSRINIKFQGIEETEVNGQGPRINEENLQQLFQKLDSLQADDILVLAGSIPSSLPDNLYEDLTKRLTAQHVKVVVDATKKALKSVLPHHPFLIKPNHHELGELFGVTIEAAEQAVPYGKKLIELGAQNVIVSMAGDGALLFTKDGVYFANVPNGKVQNSVGAGDSVVAGFIAAYSKGQAVQEAFRYGVTAGSASAFSTGFCTAELIEQYINQVNVTSL
ncbi:1-phosphofructokinase [Bacillus tianshenii]|nr:1-phosphofructokinase [Bacillus tianshenii]